MFPFRDNIRSATFPVITKALILANVLAFFYELSLGKDLDGFFQSFAVIPAKVLAFSGLGGFVADVAVPFTTSIFLHGGWMHLIGNMWYLWIFGDNVEDRLGHARFLVFYLICGAGASVAHVLLNPESSVPSIGASGAIAGVLGAYLVSYPRARVQTIVPIFVFVQIIELPALLVLGTWFLWQFFYGTASLATASPTGGGVAWWAHVGGFLVGMVLIGFFADKRRRLAEPYSF